MSNERLLPGMISEEDFEVLKEIYLRTHDIDLDEDLLRRDLEGLQEDMGRCLADLNQQNAQAYLIYLQGCNFLFRLLDEEQIEPDAAVLKLIPQYAYLTKYVAIYHPSAQGSHTNVVLNTLDHVLRTLDQRGYKTYGNMQDLLGGLLTREISLVAGIYLDQSADIERRIRHDLKNLSGWDYQKAEEFQLPRCVNLFAGGQLLAEILALLAETRREPEPEPKNVVIDMSLEDADYDLRADLEDSASPLRKAMFEPVSEVSIAIVDDDEHAMEGMLQILSYWRNVSGQQFVITGKDMLGKLLEEPAFLGNDIILLDEAMGDLTGTDVFNALKYNPAISKAVNTKAKVFASTTGGSTPHWAEHHFSNKMHVAKSRQAALSFIEFINISLKQLSH
ncbi:MAG: hypothetical protein ACOYUZ_01755 [Patescibacteria group bacterium]